MDLCHIILILYRIIIPFQMFTLPRLYGYRPFSLCSFLSGWFFAFVLVLSPDDNTAYGQELKAEPQVASAILHNWMPRPATGYTDSVKMDLLLNQSSLIQWQYPDSAMNILHQVFQKSIATGNYFFAASTKIDMGLVAMGQGDFISCFSYYKEAYHYIRNSGNDKRLLPKLFVNIGATYFYQENYEKAFEYYYAIIEYMQKVMPEDPNMIMAYNNLSDVLIHMEQYDKALYYLDLAEELMLKKKSLAYMYGYIWVNKADIALVQKRYTACLEYCDKAIAYASEYRNDEVLQACYIVRAKYYLVQNQADKAIPYLNKALHTPASTAYPYYSIVAPYYTLGDAYYQAGDFHNAERALQIALNKADDAGIVADKLKALNTLSAIYEKTGRYREALLQQHAGDILRDSIQNKEKLKLAHELEAKFRTEQKDKKIAQKEFLIEKQNRDIEHKNAQILAVASGLGIVLIIGIGSYRNFKHKNKIVTLKAKMEGEEKERSRIAKELHDGIGGMLAVLKMKLTSEQADTQPEILSLLNETAVQVRKTAHNLMPDVITEFTLKEVLTSYTEMINKTAIGLKIDLQVNSEIRIQEPSVKLSVYRMLQEMVQNIVKHAQATIANIQIFEQGGKLNLLVEDNGIGFDAKKIKRGLGLANMEARVNMLNGRIHISSSPGRGTTINIELPLS